MEGYPLESAGYTRLPPGKLALEGAILSALLVALTSGFGVLGVLTGSQTLSVVIGGIAVLGLVVYLYAVGAGRVLLGLVGILGLALCWLSPHDATDAVLAGRGIQRSVVVTEVHEHDYRGRDYVNYSCSVALDSGKELDLEVWSSCDRGVSPGDTVPLVFDPAGAVEPMEPPVADSVFTAGIRTASLSALLFVTCFVAIVRTCPREDGLLGDR